MTTKGASKIGSRLLIGAGSPAGLASSGGRIGDSGTGESPITWPRARREQRRAWSRPSFVAVSHDFPAQSVGRPLERGSGPARRPFVKKRDRATEQAKARFSNKSVAQVRRSDNLDLILSLIRRPSFRLRR